MTAVAFLQETNTNTRKNFAYLWQASKMTRTQYITIQRTTFLPHSLLVVAV